MAVKLLKFAKKKPKGPLLWMHEILHHLRNPGDDDSLVHCSKVVQDFVHPQYCQRNPLSLRIVGTYVPRQVSPSHGSSLQEWAQ